MKTTRPIYSLYIKSHAWKRQAHAARVRAGYKCQMCGRADRPLEVHHNTYENLGSEPARDLVCLCHECHTAYHLREKHAAVWRAFVWITRWFLWRRTNA